MKIEISLHVTADGAPMGVEVLTLEKREDDLAQIGLSLAEGKDLLARLQTQVIAVQAADFVARRRRCEHCGKRRRSKGRRSIRFRTPFGDAPIESPRLRGCSCEETGPRSFSPLTELFTQHVSPEMLFLETKWASLVPFGVTADLLKDVLPVGDRLNAETVRNHLHSIAKRAEAELGPEQTSFVEGYANEWAELPAPEGPIVVGADGGYVRAREPDREGRNTHFEVMVGKSIADDREDRYFGLVQSHDAKPRRRLHEVLREQGLEMNQSVTFLTDGADTVRAMANLMSPCAEHVLDWFHITMRLTVLRQYARGLAHHDKKEGEEIEHRLKRIKGFLWNGNVRDASSFIDTIVWDLEEIETDYPSIKALRKAADEFRVYIGNNAGSIPNYAERHRYGERVSTSFVESTVNTMVGKRFAKKQQMRWSKKGAHLLLQTRARTLDGTLRTKFESWFPGLAVNANRPNEEISAAA